MREKLRDRFSTLDWSRRDGHTPRSGPGSTLAHTKNIRAALPELFGEFAIRVFVDAPCGDWHWMRHVDLSDVKYIGLDIVSEIVRANEAEHAREGISFSVADITSDPLPEADMLMCRDCLFHLKFWLRWAFFENFVASGTRYLLTTVHDNPVNRNVPENGKFRWFNPRLPPFSFSDPLRLVPDIPTPTETELKEDFRGRRYMGLWHRDQIERAIRAHKADGDTPVAGRDQPDPTTKPD